MSAFTRRSKDDPARLGAVARTGLLDTPPESSFDRLTRLAAKLLRVPVTFISLVDRDRDFYKSCYGFPEPLASRRQLEGATFCHLTLGSSSPLVIDDTTVDPAHREVPTVKTLGVRAYAGIPLVDTEGFVLGSFCAIDFEPRRWTPEDVEVLEELARSTMNEIALRRALEESAESLRAALDSLRAREEVLALVAHDLRNPLNIISMSTGVLSTAPGLAPHGAAFERISRATRSMNALVEDLLDFSTSAAKPILRQRVRFDPADLLRDAAAMLTPLAQRSGIALSVRADASLPAVLVDYERILRVFSNLVGNAFKASRTGQTVVLEATVGGSGEVRFAVVDYGCGISVSNLAHIFEPFWQENRKDTRGVGLGLAIVKSHVEAHGGTVSVESVEGVGSRFEFTLPAAT